MNRIDVIEGNLSDRKNISPFEVATSEVLDLNWFASLYVVDALGNEPLIAKDITNLKTLDNRSFQAYLTHEDTSLLGVGEFYLVVILVNNAVAPKYKKEIQIDLNVLVKGLA